MLGVLPKLWPPPRIIVVNVLRTAWIILVLWYEICVFEHVLRDCLWPGIPQVRTQYLELKLILTRQLPASRPRLSHFTCIGGCRPSNS